VYKKKGREREKTPFQNPKPPVIQRARKFLNASYISNAAGFQVLGAPLAKEYEEREKREEKEKKREDLWKER